MDLLGEWKFTVEGWIDQFESWATDMRKRVAAQTETTTISERTPAQVVSTDISIALRTGAQLLRQGGERANGIDAEKLLKLPTDWKYLQHRIQSSENIRSAKKFTH